ncbi:hypothetical protein JNK13_09590 [bacterium]|nr:hypothetical protein [bacterium]
MKLILNFSALMSAINEHGIAALGLGNALYALMWTEEIAKRHARKICPQFLPVLEKAIAEGRVAFKDSSKDKMTFAKVSDLLTRNRCKPLSSTEGGYGFYQVHQRCVDPRIEVTSSFQKKPLRKAA